MSWIWIFWARSVLWALVVPKLTFLLATEGWSGQPYTNKLCPNTIETHVVTKTGVPLTPTMSPRGSQLNESDQSERCKKEGGMTRVRRSWVQILVQPKDCFAKSRLKVTCIIIFVWNFYIIQVCHASVIPWIQMKSLLWKANLTDLDVPGWSEWMGRESGSWPVFRLPALWRHSPGTEQIYYLINRYTGIFS